MNYIRLILLKKVFKDMQFTLHWIKYILPKLLGKLGFKKFRDFLNIFLIGEMKGENKLKELLLNDKPILVGRLGSSEVDSLITIYSYLNGLSKKILDPYISQLYFNAGFFSTNQDPQLDLKEIKIFYDLMIEALQKADMLFSFNWDLESFLLRKFHKKKAYNHSGLSFIKPNPWTSFLKNKSILVIHPFAETMSKQYENRQKLFDFDDVLPDMNVKFLKAIQTIADNNHFEFNTWKEALMSMYEKAIKIDFEVALIGCGSYGLPLALLLKNYGKKAIHLGGVTQLLFGIKGVRWDDTGIYNSFWVRPDSSEIPKNSNKIEGGAYW